MRTLSRLKEIHRKKPAPEYLLLVAFTTIVIVSPLQLRHDDEVRFELARESLSGNSLIDAKYSIAFIWVLKVLVSIGRQFGNDFLFVQFLLPFLLVIAASLLTWSVGKGRTLTVRLVVAHSTVFSLAGAYVVSPNSDLFSAVLIVIGYVVLLENPIPTTVLNQIVGIFALALAGWNSPPHVASIALIGFVVLIKARAPQILVAALAGLTLVTIEASVANGRLALSKYGLEGGAPNVLPWENVVGFGYPILFGVVGILFSLGRGLVFFIPGLWFSTTTSRQKTLRPTDLLLIHTAILIPIYGSWWAWYGGVGFGPRFFLVGAFAGAGLLGYSADRLSSANKKWWICIALALSTYVALVGALIHISNNTYNRCVDDNFYFEPICWYVAEYSPLLSPLWDEFNPIGVRGYLFIGLGVVSVLTIVVKLLAQKPSRT